MLSRRNFGGAAEAGGRLQRGQVFALARATSRPLAAVAALALVAGGVAACGGTSGGTSATVAGSHKAAAKQLLQYGVPSANVADGVSNPAAQPFSDGPVLSLAYAPLIHQDPNGKLGPGLAVSWGYVKGHKVFDLTLRHNARFSDGTLVTAPAVAKWLSYYAKANTPFSSSLGPNPKFRAMNKWTARITMTQPNPDVPVTLSQLLEWGTVASPKAVANPKLLKTATDGAGPYMLDPAKSVPGDHWTFVPNPHYYDQSAIKFSEVYLKAFSDSSSMLQAEEAGQLDVEWSLDSSTASAAASAGLQISSAPYSTYYFDLNTKIPALGNIRVRQAMNYALNRTAIAQALFGKYGRITSEAQETSDADPGLESYYSYDPAKAKSLLAAAGYPKGFSTTLIDPGGSWQTPSEVVASDLQAVGIKLHVVTLSVPAWEARSAKFEDGLTAAGSSVGATTPTLYPLFVGPHSSLRAELAVPSQVNSLYNAGLSAKNPAPDWKHMWSLLTKQATFLPFAVSSEFLYHSKSLVANIGSGDPWPDPTEWYFK